MTEMFHCTPISNMESILKDGLIPQIGPRSKKLDEEAGVFLFASYEACEDALMGWLGSEFEELYAEPIVLKVVVPDNFSLEEPVEWERVSRVKIEPQYIEFFQFEGSF